jgi:cysteine-rich repeat protein
MVALPPATSSSGYKCDGSTCTPTTCGDGKVEGAEGCDDGNNLPFDGCSADCQMGARLSGDSCTSKCGDGIVLNEDCDDGNAGSGDGCSKDCKVEARLDLHPAHARRQDAGAGFLPRLQVPQSQRLRGRRDRLDYRLCRHGQTGPGQPMASRLHTA